MLWAQGAMALVFLLPVAILHPFPVTVPMNWVYLIFSNLAVLSGTACLYRGLATGRVSLVAPIMACYGAIGAVISIVTGEKVGAAAMLGLAAAAAGAILSASAGENTGENNRSGWQLAAGAAILYGVGFWLQGKFVEPRFGPRLTIWLYYTMSVVLTGAFCLVRRYPVRLQSPSNLV